MTPTSERQREIDAEVAELAARIVVLMAERRGQSRLEVFISQRIERREGCDMDFGNFAAAFRAQLGHKEQREWPHVRIRQELSASGWNVGGFNDEIRNAVWKRD